MVALGKNLKRVFVADWCGVWRCVAFGSLSQCYSD